MTIRRGSDYGERRPLPTDGLIASSDAELRSIVLDQRSSGEQHITVGLLGGDLCRTVGGTGARGRLHGPEARTLPIDLGLVTIEDETIPFVAHVVSPRLFGPNFFAAMNAQWSGAFDLGPRSHPGDGLIDITQGSLRWRQRRLARRRARTGTHLPHPGLATMRVQEAAIDFDSTVELLIDGALRSRARSVRIRVLPDAFSIVI